MVFANPNFECVLDEEGKNISECHRKGEETLLLFLGSDSWIEVGWCERN